MRSTLILLLLLLATFGARAQTLANFEAKNGQCPSAKEQENIGARVYGRLGRGLGFTFVMRDPVELFENATPASARLQSVTPPDLFKRVTLYGQAGAGRPDHRLLIGWTNVTASATLCGWIAQKDLLLIPNDQLIGDRDGQLWHGPKPLLVRDVDTSDKRSRLMARAVLNNRSAAGNVVYAYRDPLKASPTASDIPPNDNLVSRKLALSEIFSIFAITNGQPRLAQAGGGETAATESRYFLLGRYPAGGDGTEIVGWVHYNDVYLWSSRMALYWAPGGIGKGYGTMSGDGIVSGQPFVKAPDPLPEQPSANIARYPALESLPDPHTVWDKAGHLSNLERADPVHLSQLVNVYEIAIPFKACPPNGGKCEEAEELDKQRRQFADRVTRLGNSDILFLIDGTDSMDQYFSSTAAAIRDFIHDDLAPQGQSNAVSMRIGVVAYGDYVGSVASPDQVQFEWIVPMFDPYGGASELALKKLTDFHIRPGRDIHHDLLEAPFAALIRAAKTVDWREEAGSRIIIHIADDGNREKDKRSPEPESDGIVERVGIDDVVAALSQPARGGAPITYVPINVVGVPDGSRPYAIMARKAFLSQTAEIARRRPGAVATIDPVIRTTTNTDKPTETPQQRQTAVHTALTNARKIYGKEMDIISLREFCASNSNAAECKQLDEIEKPNSDPVVQAAVATLEANGFSRDEINRMFNRRQTVATAFVPPVETVDGVPREAVTYWVALDENALTEMQETLHGLCVAFVPLRGTHGNTGDPGSAFQDALTNIASSLQTGPDQVSPKDTLGTLLSLPFWEREKVLSLDRGLFSELFQLAAGQDQATAAKAKTELDRLRRSFCASSGLLAQVQTGLLPTVPLSELTLNEDYNLRTVAKQWKPYRWDTVTGVGEKLYFIPLEYFPTDNPPPVTDVAGHPLP